MNEAQPSINLMESETYCVNHPTVPTGCAATSVAIHLRQMRGENTGWLSLPVVRQESAGRVLHRPHPWTMS